CSQPARWVAVDLRRKGLAGGNLVPPIALRNMWTADPDLADLVGVQPIKVFGIDDGNSFAHDRAPTADRDPRVRLSGRRTHATIAQLDPADRPGHVTCAAHATRDQDGCLGHSVERTHGTRVEAIRRKRADKPFDRIGMDWFGGID